MITREDIDKLEEWTATGQATDTVRAWHSQILTELIEYIKYIEGEMAKTRDRNVELEELVRLLQPVSM